MMTTMMMMTQSKRGTDQQRQSQKARLMKFFLVSVTLSLVTYFRLARNTNSCKVSHW